MSPDDVINSYARAWEEADDASRWKLLGDSWSDEGLYCDRMARADGRQALNDLIKGYQAQIPGYSVSLTSEVDVHDEFARFTWEIRHPDGSLVLDGTDFATFDADGRIMQLVGFSPPMPATPA